MPNNNRTKEQRKNAAAVAAFGSGKPPQQQKNKPVAGVRRQNESQDQFQARMNGQDNTDIDAIFRGIQQTRGMVRRDMSGNIVSPNAPSGLDKLYADNPHLRGAAERQAQNDQQARGNMYQQAAQNSVMRAAQQNQPNPNLVTGADGYRTIFGPNGNVVGTTAPVGDGQKRVFDDASGQMVPMDQWFKDRQEVQTSKGMTPTPMQQAAQRSVASKPSGMDQIFDGGVKQFSPSGGTAGDLVGSSGSQGAPDGELFGQMPEFSSGGMAMPQQPQNALPNDLGSVFAQQSRQKYFSPSQLSGPLQATPEQAQVKRDLNAMSNLQFRMADFYPGSDYAHLEKLFPGFKFDSHATTNQALDALRQRVSLYK